MRAPLRYLAAMQSVVDRVHGAYAGHPTRSHHDERACPVLEVKYVELWCPGCLEPTRTLWTGARVRVTYRGFAACSS